MKRAVKILFFWHIFVFVNVFVSLSTMLLSESHFIESAVTHFEKKQISSK